MIDAAFLYPTTTNDDDDENQVQHDYSSNFINSDNNKYHQDFTPRHHKIFVVTLHKKNKWKRKKRKEEDVLSVVDPSSRTAKFEEMTNLSSFICNDHPRRNTVTTIMKMMMRMMWLLQMMMANIHDGMIDTIVNHFIASSSSWTMLEQEQQQHDAGYCYLTGKDRCCMGYILPHNGRVCVHASNQVQKREGRFVMYQ